MDKIISILFCLNHFSKEQLTKSLNDLLALKVKECFEVIFITDVNNYQTLSDIIQSKQYVEFKSSKLLLTSQELSSSLAFAQGIQLAQGDYVIFWTSDLVVSPSFFIDFFANQNFDFNADVVGVYNQTNTPKYLVNLMEDYFSSNANQFSNELFLFVGLNNITFNVYSKNFLQKTKIIRNLKDHFYPFIFKLYLLQSVKRWYFIKIDSLMVNYQNQKDARSIYNFYFQIHFFMNDKHLRKVFLNNKDISLRETLEFLIIYLLLVQFIDILLCSSLSCSKINFFISLAYNLVMKYFPNYAKNVHLKKSSPLNKYLIKFQPKKSYIQQNFPFFSSINNESRKNNSNI